MDRKQQREALQREQQQSSLDIQEAQEAKAAWNYLHNHLERRRKEILGEFLSLGTLDKDEFLFSALAVKAAFGAAESLEADLTNSIKKGESALFRLPDIRAGLNKLDELEEK